MPEIYVIGDIHGQLHTFTTLLLENGIVKEQDPDGPVSGAPAPGEPRLVWDAGEAHLWLMGDYCDRGPDGIGVIELIIDLQAQARQAGGQVEALIGNHDLFLITVARCGDAVSDWQGKTFSEIWKEIGGRETDLEGLTDSHLDWLCNLPALGREDGVLLLHADCELYLQIGYSLEQVNAHFRQVCRNGTPVELDWMLGEFGKHHIFQGENHGELANFIGAYGGRRIIHGHTPISKVSDMAPEEIRQALVYAQGRCVNVDGGMYLGGPGFVHRLETDGSDR